MNKVELVGDRYELKSVGCSLIDSDRRDSAIYMRLKSAGLPKSERCCFTNTSSISCVTACQLMHGPSFLKIEYFLE